MFLNIIYVLIWTILVITNNKFLKIVYDTRSSMYYDNGYEHH